MALHNSPNGPYVIQANTVNAEVLRQALSAMVPSQGVVNTGDYLVAAHGTPNMTVDVASGFAVVTGTQAAAQGAYQVYNDATVSVAITASDPTNPRIDIICLSIQDAQYSGGSNQAVLQAIAGTPAGSPVAPSAPANSLILAQVAVAALATTIVGGNVTDKRTLCGGLGNRSAWTAFTPTWTCANTAPSVGNGTLAGYYLLTGKTCHLNIYLLFGGTTSGGTGAWTFSLPGGITGKTGTEQDIPLKCFTAGNTSNYVGFGVIGSGASTITPYAPTGATSSNCAQVQNTNAGGGVGVGVPVVSAAYSFVASSILVIHGQFQTA